MTTINHGHPAPAPAGRRGLPRWPLFLIAAPAAAAVWSGWVGLGGLCGFGIVHPLPGIVPGFQLNTAITLPVGVEAYGAYALRAWLTPGISDLARKYAARSAVGSLGLGMAGQVIYHLLSAAHAIRAPWPVVTLVSCLPVVALALGSGLAHLLRDTAPAQEAGPAPVPAAPPVQAPPEPGPVPYADRRTSPDPDHHPGRTPARTAGEPGRGEAGRAGIVAELADQIRDAIEAGDRWQPDYPALMERTGFRRSWCEKAVRDARTAAFRTAVPASAVRTAAPDPGPRTDTPGAPPAPDGAARAARPVLHAVDGTAR
jgi:hypothetical protein